METRRLTAFIKMVDLGSLTRAADQLGIAQPALSQQVAALEQEFGAQLLVRSRQGVTPTSAGRALYRHAQVVLKQLQQARAEIRFAGDEVAGTVSVGMPLSISSVVATPLLRALRELHPGVRLHVADGMGGELLSEQTLNGRLDLCLLSKAYSTHGMDLEPLFSQRFHLICTREAQSEFGRDTVSVSDLNDYPLVLASRTNRLRQAIDEAFASKGLTPRVMAELDSFESLRAVAAAGIGATIIPWSPQTAQSGLAMIDIVDPPIERDVYLAKLSATPLSTPAEAVYGLIKAIVATTITTGEWVGVRAATPEIA